MMDPRLKISVGTSNNGSFVYNKRAKEILELKYR